MGIKVYPYPAHVGTVPAGKIAILKQNINFLKQYCEVRRQNGREPNNIGEEYQVMMVNRTYQT